MWMDDEKIAWLGAIVFTLLLVGSFVCCGQFVNAREWNDGICSSCGGRYVYEQAVGHAYSTSYIYKCDQCGKTIEIGERMD